MPKITVTLSKIDVFKIFAGFSAFTFLLLALGAYENAFVNIPTIFIALFCYVVCVKPISRNSIIINQRGVAFYTLFICFTSVFALYSTGVGLFAENQEMAKLNVSNFPVLMRFFRVGVPIAIFLMFLSNVRHKELWFLFFLAISLGFGYKGYMAFPLAGYFAVRVITFSGLKFSVNAFISSLLAIYTVNILFDVDLYYLYNRLILGQNEAAAFFENSNSIDIEYSAIDELMFVFKKFFGYDVYTFNQLLTLEIYGSNLYGISTSVQYTYQLELYDALDWIVLTLSLFAMFGISILFRGVGRLVYFMALTSAISEGLLNGMLLYKMMDSCISYIMVFAIPFKLINMLHSPVRAIPRRLVIANA